MKVTVQIHSRLKARLSRKAREALTATTQRMAPIALNTITRYASTKLRHTADAYIAALPDSIHIEENALLIELESPAREIELGYPARDMKPGLLNSANVKTSKDGSKYVDIPFSHKYSTFPEAIQSRVNRSIRRERASAAEQDRQEQNPLRVTRKLPGSEHTQSRRDKRGRTKDVTVSRKTSLWSDMIRTAAKAGKASYETIRRVSSKSDAQSWWHPGADGVHVLKLVKDELKDVMAHIFKDEMMKRGLKTK